LLFAEADVLTELLPYLKKSLNLVDAEVWSVQDALSKNESGFSKAIIEGAEPGTPAFEFRNI
jgi:leucyl-tRNA synthetase